MDIRERLERELRRALDRIRGATGAVAVPDARAEASVAPGADPMDAVRQAEDREIGFATRSLLMRRTQRLAEALDRLRMGTYGLCEMCGDPIAPARLVAAPEVVTCVTCQDREERLARRAGGTVGDPGASEEAFDE
jgi:DnaK suppressor protein